MPKSINQKLKLLYLLKIFEENTDEEHGLTIAEIAEKLKAFDISCERKSIYADIEALRSFGADICYKHGKNYEYFLASRSFELPELKLLADAVASAKFITEKKSLQLIEKIETLASEHDAKKLRRQVFIANRVKTINEQIYYNVDKIHLAISENRQISFKYFEYTVDKKKHYRNDEGLYTASPYALTWDDENYYMIAFYEKYNNLSNFRVDKMEDISILSEKRIESDKNFDLANYSKKNFSMFRGVEQTLRLEASNSLVGVFFDRFGKDITVIPKTENTFETHIEVAISPSFLGWLFQFGDKVKILSPDSLIDLMKEHIDKIDKIYL